MLLRPTSALRSRAAVAAAASSFLGSSRPAAVLQVHNHRHLHLRLRFPPTTTTTSSRARLLSSTSARRSFSSSSSSSATTTTSMADTGTGTGTTTADVAAGDSSAIITPESLKATLSSKLSTTYVAIEDMSGGCGQAFNAIIVSPDFDKKTHLQRHRLVNSALKAEIAAIHAWTPRCLTPAQWEQEQAQAQAQAQ